MKKSSLFISAFLTTFVLAVLAGVFNTQHTFTGSLPVSTTLPPPVLHVVSTLPTVITFQEVVQIAPSISPTIITSQDAAQIASSFIGRSDLYLLESVIYNGQSVYKIIFSSGDIVYVSPQGQVLSSVPAPTITIGMDPTSVPVPTSTSVPSNSSPNEKNDDD